jgi:hypothetical protein
MVSLITLSDGNFGTENDGEDSYLKPTVTVAFPFCLMTKKAPRLQGRLSCSDFSLKIELDAVNQKIPLLIKYNNCREVAILHPDAEPVPSVDREAVAPILEGVTPCRVR